MITERVGDLFQSPMQTIAITINVVGAMGKGVAKTCKELYPECLPEYLKHYKYGYDTPVSYDSYLERAVRTLRTFKIDEKRQLLFFPTKQHWRMPSSLEWIEDNLITLTEKYQDLGITSLALPPLGCGNGGLERNVVFPLIYRRLKGLDIPIELYV